MVFLEKFQTDNTCMKREEVVTEIERYFVLPGQACAYMVGCQTIISLREKAQATLGHKFDLKQFHDGLCVFEIIRLNDLVTF